MKSNFYFIGNYSNIYKKPSNLSEVTSQIICGEKFKILSKNKGWIKIKLLFDNYVGYIQNKQFTQKTNFNYKVSNLKAKVFKRPNLETKSFLTFGSKVSAVDENKNYIKIQKNKWIKKTDIKKIESDFDGITSFETIEHLNDPNYFLKDLAHLSNRSTKFFVSCPNEKKLPFSKEKFKFHVQHFTPSQLEKLLDNNGWAVIRKNSINNKFSKIISNNCEGNYLLYECKIK